MPDLQRIIEIVFQGTDSVGGAVTSVSRGLGAVADKAQTVTGPLADTADLLLKVDAALLAMGTTMVGFAINEAGKFQDATNEINTLIDASPEKFDALKRAIIDYSRDSTASLDSINNAIYSGISAGVEYEDVISVVAAAEKLAVAGRADLNATTLALVSTLNAYGASVADAGRFSDILFSAVKEGQTTLPLLSDSLAQVTGVAVAAGVPFSDLAGAVAELTTKGLPTSQAVTAIKAALSNIIKPSKDAKNAARELGVEFDVNALKTKGLDGVLRELAFATGGNVTQMGRFFGSVEGLNGVMALSVNGGKDFTDTLKSIRDSAGATAEAYEKMAGSFVNVNQNVSNNLKATLVEVGGKLLDQYGETAKALGSVFAGVGEGVSAGSFDPVLDIINAFGERAQDAMEEIARNLPAALELIDWGGISTALVDLGGAIAQLFRGVDVSTPEGLANAIQKVADAGEFLVNVTKGIVDGLRPFIEQAAKLLSSLIDISPEAEKTAGAFIGVGKGLNVLLGVVGPATDAIESLGTGLQAIAGASILKTLSGVEGGLASLATKLGAAGLAAGGVTFAFTEMAEAFDDYTERNEQYQRAMDGLADTDARLAQSLQSIGDNLGFAIKNMAEFNKLADEGKIVFDEASGSWQRASDAVEAHGAEQLLTAEQISKSIELENLLNEAIAEEAANIADSDAAAASRSESRKKEAEFTVEIINGVKTYTQVIGKKSEAVRADVKAVEDAISASVEYRLELEKLASNERIKNIEARISLETAQLEAATATTIAAFESIDATITSTGDLLGKLFGNLADAGSLREKFALEDQIEKENRLREDAAKLQGDLTRAQTEYLRERARSLSQGDALVKIEADGLEPELEAFMWKILERIQVRASEEGAEFLLGIA